MQQPPSLDLDQLPDVGAGQVRYGVGPMATPAIVDLAQDHSVLWVGAVQVWSFQYALHSIQWPLSNPAAACHAAGEGKMVAMAVAVVPNDQLVKTTAKDRRVEAASSC